MIQQIGLFDVIHGFVGSYTDVDIGLVLVDDALDQQTVGIVRIKSKNSINPFQSLQIIEENGGKPIRDPICPNNTSKWPIQDECHYCNNSVLFDDAS